uniref:Uncharacterized protein n=1 Tax=Anguilla anguilla TaxID=7936 RepID=A0A0E9SY18_ANGAN
MKGYRTIYRAQQIHEICAAVQTFVKHLLTIFALFTTCYKCK